MTRTILKEEHICKNIRTKGSYRLLQYQMTVIQYSLETPVKKIC